MQKKVSDLLAEFLVNKNIRHAFGIIGSGNAHIFDSITKLGETEIVCVHHEQAAVMAAQIYFRLTGHMSAVLLTTGAGSTNGVTGVVSAWMDSIPVLIISGNENSKFTQESNPLRIWGVQGYDSSAMVEKVTKYSRRLLQPIDVLKELEKSYAIAGSQRPGPVWLDIPMNIQSALVETDDCPLHQDAAPALSIPSGSALVTADTAVESVFEKLSRASRPVLWLGHGIRLAGGTQLIPQLLEKLQIPTLVSWAGLDMIDSDHPLVFGRAGVYGQRGANFVLQNCDFLLTIGTRLAIPQVGYDISEFVRAADIAIVDIDADELQKYPEREMTRILADAKDFIQKLSEKAEDSEYFKVPRYADWIKQCNHYREMYPWVGPEHKDKDGFINSYSFMERLIPFLKNDQIIVTDMGTALLSGHQVLKIKDGQRMMTSTGLGEMGYGLPAAIGASFARDRGEVLCLNCDGGMMMNLQELQTVAHHRLPIKLFIFNNDGYLMIKHTQKALFSGRYSGTDAKSGVTCPDFSKLGAVFGFKSYQIRSWEDFDSVIPLVQAEDGPVICEVFTHPEQLFVPKLGLSLQKDGSIISPPLEDLLPFIPRDELRKNMLIGIHPKSELIKPNAL